MKKILSVILALILVFSMIPFAISAGAEEHYMIWVGNTEVTSDNRHDILNDGGKAQYDPRTNTLTLDEPVISEPYFSDDLRENCCIYANPINDEDLVITGSYHMDNQIVWLSQVGLAVDYGGNTTIRGDFSFTGRDSDYNFNTKGSCPTITFDGDFEGNNLWVGKANFVIKSGGSFKATSDVIGLSFPNLTVESGMKRVELSGGYSAVNFESDDPITLGKGMTITSPENGYQQNFMYYDADGNIATTIVIESILPFDGAGTEDDPYLIKSEDDWTKLGEYVSCTNKETCFRLENDLSINKMLGDDDAPFKGTFDGNGKKLTADLTADGINAPFLFIKDATIKNLTIDGNGGTTTVHNEETGEDEEVDEITADDDLLYSEYYELNNSVFSKEGYVLSGWNTRPNGTGDSYAANDSVNKMTATNGGEAKLYAQWHKPDFVLTFDAQGGKSVDDKTYTFVTGETTYYGDLPETTRNGYTFDGWWTAASGGTRIKKTAAVLSKMITATLMITDCIRSS